MSLSRGLWVELQVLHGLILRETRTRFGAHQLGYLWALLEPLLWIGTLYAVFELGQRSAPSGMTMVGFLATGLLPYQLFRDSAAKVQASISANKGLLYYPQVQPLDLMCSRVILEGATAVSVFTVLLGGEALILGKLEIDSLLTVILGLALAGGLGGALGGVLCALGTFSNAVERFSGPLLRPLFWISAIFFTANDLPPQLRDALLYNPVLHVVEIVRDGWFPSYRADHATPLYPLTWIFVLTFFALALERVARRRIEVA